MARKCLLCGAALVGSLKTCPSCNPAASRRPRILPRSKVRINTGSGMGLWVALIVVAAILVVIVWVTYFGMFGRRP